VRTPVLDEQDDRPSKSVHCLMCNYVKADVALPGENHTSELRDITCHMGSHSVNLPPDTSEHAPPSPSRADWYSIYLPQRDGRLS